MEQSANAGTVTKVRVFVDRAAITRKQSLSAPTRELCFAPIPLDADTATFRAQAEIGGAAVKVTGVSWSMVYATDADGRRAALQRELQALEQQLSRLEDEESAETHALSRLERYAEIATRTLSHQWMEREPPFAEWSAVFDALRSRRAALAMARAERLERRTRAQEQRAELLAEDQRLGRPMGLGYRVQISLDPGTAVGALEVELTYLSKKAQWVPIYDARHLIQGTERLELTAVALVRQTTGEDWSEVELIATTARPPLSEPPPELTTLMVTGYQGATERELQSTVRSEERLPGGSGRGEERAPASVEHQAPGKVSIPASGHPVRVELFKCELPCRSRLEVAPLERPVALLVADLENRTGRVLLPGKVNVFRGANYAGQARIGFVAALERLRIPLGTDASIRVKREVSAEPERRAVSGSVSYSYSARLTLENVGERAAEVVVRDRVPVSRSEEATVKIVEIDRAAEVHPETGLTTLALNLPPHARRELSMVFKISAPRGFRLTPPPVV